ncbi:DUF3068 domain-containing protein [Hoyosella rhizosphaerae]|nr:DUF3068 domain-containing protein [Hoyosella rhizosphaerae]MBN4927680.1 DUF3068 domain-containing protein [Hoyosella rhizosphaerae]
MPARTLSSARIVASLMVGLGVFLLALAVLLPLYTLPKLQKLPLAFEAVQVMEGEGMLLNTGKFLAGDDDALEESVPLRTQRFVTVEDPSDDRNATLQGGFTFMRADTSPGRGLLGAHIDRVTIDRETAVPVNEPIASLQTDREAPAAQLPRDGLQYQFPYGTEKRSYPFYDLTARSSFDIDFVEETTVDGMTVYRFRHTIEPVDLFRATRDQTNRIGMPKSAWGIADGAADADEIVFMSRHYTVERDLWVEPASGMIVDSRERVKQFFGMNPTDEAVTVLSYDLRFTNDTISALASQAQAERDRVQFAVSAGPVTISAAWLLAIAGLITLVGGIVLGTRKPRTDNDSPSDDSSDDPSDDSSSVTELSDDPAVNLYTQTYANSDSGSRG